MNDATTIANRYYDALRNAGEGLAPLLDGDMRFEGPMEQFRGPDRLVEVAKTFGPALKDIIIHKQWADGDDVCTIYDFVMAKVGPVRMAEWVRVKNEAIIDIKLYFDPKPFAGMM